MRYIIGIASALIAIACGTADISKLQDGETCWFHEGEAVRCADVYVPTATPTPGDIVMQDGEPASFILAFGQNTLGCADGCPTRRLLINNCIIVENPTESTVKGLPAFAVQDSNRQHFEDETSGGNECEVKMYDRSPSFDWVEINKVGQD